MALTTSVLHDDGIAILALAGELDLAVTADLDAVVDDVLAGGLRLVLVDLDALSFCDSTGLGALLRASRRVREAGGTCVVAGARDAVARLLALTSMRLALDLAPDVQTALVALRESQDA
ncbi:MAG: anti-sigma factor antagonist (spoIIAA-2)/anti sigma b factor antagonist RsbV [Frankiales bacterium]|jgi:anti-sigma B factor antagonist|nr:anti-sigma factor antagonist (spoIIAA-2)/anti sigma b factor antagonist RsbV [Frankiales bacterium]